MAKSEFMVLRGKRDYLHGNSMFSYFVEVAGDASLTDIDLVISKQTNQIIDLIAVDKDDERPLIATFHCAGFSAKLVETEQPINRLVPYDDPTAGISLDADASLANIGTSVPGYVFIDHLVSAYKQLLTQRFRERNAKWRFVRISLAHIPDGDYIVTFNRIVSACFFEGIIAQGNENLGHIYFAD
jgi:hypothetical protein